MRWIEIAAAGGNRRLLSGADALDSGTRQIRIGGALGFWGDRSDAIFELIRGGPLDYVIMDYLAEVTMSIL